MIMGAIAMQLHRSSIPNFIGGGWGVIHCSATYKFYMLNYIHNTTHNNIIIIIIINRKDIARKELYFTGKVQLRNIYKIRQATVYFTK